MLDLDTDLAARVDKRLREEDIIWFTTVTPKGVPVSNPVWFDWDGTHIIINTARGRVKDKILRRHPKVAVLISAPDDAYRYIHLRGRVVGETEEGAYEEICDLREKYEGDRNFPKRPRQVRVTYKILPDKVFADTLRFNS